MRAVIMTRSAMYGANCVAAIDVETGAFKRFVKLTKAGTAPLDDFDLICIETLLACDPLDLVDVDVIEASPFEHQTENVIIDSSKGFRRIGAIDLSDVLLFHSLDNEQNSILGGKKHTLSIAETKNFGHSLELREVNNLIITKKPDGKPKADFESGGYRYRGFSITDKKYYNLRGTQEAGMEQAVVVFSLAEQPVKTGSFAAFYKFLAAIFPMKNL